MDKGKKGKSEKIGFFKKLGIGVLSSIALFGLNERANAGVCNISAQSPETLFYQYQDKGKYMYADNWQYHGNHNYLDKGMYVVADKQRYEYLDDWQYRHDDFYFQEIYKDFFRNFSVHPFPAKDGDIFRYPDENPLAQSDYFKMLNGYEDPFNTELNFYLVRELFGKNLNPCPGRISKGVPAFEGFSNYQDYYTAKFLSSPVSERYSSCCSPVFWGGQLSFNDSSVFYEFCPCDKVIPEPSTVALLGLGSLALLRGRKKKEKEQKN